jgi:hypothetical protein
MLKQRSARRRAALVVSLSVLVSAIAVGGVRAASESAADTFAVSLTVSGGLLEHGIGQEVSVSANGRYVSFLYDSQDFDSEAPLGLSQVYVKDLETGGVRLASRASGLAGAPANGVGPAEVERPFISGNGRFVAFDTSADDLVAGFPAATEFPRHVYRRDLQTGETVLVDRVTGPSGAIVTAEARLQSISADGRYVLFTSPVEDLEDPGGEHLPGNETVYLRDLQEGTTVAVDREDGPAGELASEGAEEGVASNDGRYVLFTSASLNLPDANGEYQVYRRDLQTGETLLISRSEATESAPEGEPADGYAYEAFFVGASDCRIAFYAEETTNLDPGGEDPTRGIYLRDLCASTPTTTLVSVRENGESFEEAESPVTTDDGRIGFEAQNPFPERRHFYLRDVAAGTTTLIDRATGAAGDPGNSGVEWNAISANGCRAAFATESTNLIVPAPPETADRQAYVRQLAPCVPQPLRGGGQVPTGGGDPGKRSAGPALASEVKLQRLGGKALWLGFDGPGRARVRVQKLLTEPKRGWKLAKSVIVTAAGAGQCEVDLAMLAPGRYRLKFRLQGNPDNLTLTRPFVVRG